MGFDAGAISARAELDLTAFQQSLNTALDGLNRLDAALQTVGPARLTLDTGPLAQQARQQVAQVTKAVQEIPKGKLELDTAPARASLLQMSSLFDALRTRVGTLPLAPQFDVRGLRSGLSAATKELGVLDNAAGRLAGLGIGAAAMGLLAKAAFDLGKAFDDASDQITVATGAVGQDLTELQGTFQRVLGSLPVTMKDTAEAISILRPRLDLTGESLDKVATSVLELSRLTGTNLAANARATAQAFQAWQVEADQMPEVLDRVLRVSQQTGVSVTDLLQNVAQGAPLFQQFGLSLTQGLALLGQLEKNGLDATTAMVGLRQAFSKFTETGTDPAQGLRDLLEAIRDVPDESKAAELGLLAFGERVGARLVPAIREGRLNFEGLAATVAEGGDTIAAAAARTRDSAESFREAMNRLALAFKPVGDSMFAFASGTVEAMETAGAAIDRFLQGAGLAFLRFRQALAQLQSIAAPVAPEQEAPILRFDPDAAANVSTLINQLTGVEPAAAAAETALEGVDAATEGIGAKAARNTDALEASLGKTKNTAFDLAKALQAAGSDRTAISQALDYARALGLIDQAIQALDPAIAAEIAALRVEATALTDAGERHAALAVAAERAQAALRDRQAAAEAIALADKAAAAAAGVLDERYKALASGALPALTRQQIELVAALQAAGDPASAAAVAMSALGVSAELVNQALNGTGAEAAAAAEQIKRIADTADVAANANKLIQDSARSMLNTLAQGLPAADQAWIQYVAARQGDREALRELYAQMGGDQAAFDRATAQQQQQLIQRLQQQREAARVLREEGRLLPAPQQPDLFRQSQQQLDALHRTASRAANEFSISVSRTIEDFNRGQAAFAQQGREVEATFEQGQREARESLQSNLAQIGQARASAFGEFARSALREQEDFQRAWERQQRDFAQQDAESIRGLREQAGDLLVGAASEFHDAAAASLNDLLGLSGDALRSAAAGVVDRFSGVSEAARQASAQIIEAQQTMLDRVRDTFQQINSQAADAARNIRDQLQQAAVSTAQVLSGFAVTLPGQGGAEASAAQQASDQRTQAILQANLQLAARASKQQELLTTAAKASAQLDKAGQDAEKDFNKQVLENARQAREQRQQMIVQLTRMVEGFQRGAFQTQQARTDQRADTDTARDRANQDATRALGQAITQLNAQAAQAQQQAAQQLRALEAQREAQRTALEQQQRLAELQFRRQLFDDFRHDRERREDLAREEDRIDREVEDALRFAHMADTLDSIEDRLRRTGQTFDFHENVFMDPAAELMERVAQRWQERVAQGVG